ncbi:MAG: ORF6N domain-containing protein [bacterium]|nr:ORF6N domain-containing protein [bacterium]
MAKTDSLIPIERIVSQIYLIRGEKVMLDSDLAVLYGVETKSLNKAVTRNRRRFPDDFMFRLTREEWDALRFQIGTSNEGRGGRRYLPRVFTEQGVAMLSSVLRSDRAADVNVAIMRTFVRLRQAIATNEELARKVAQLGRPFNGSRSLLTTGTVVASQSSGATGASVYGRKHSGTRSRDSQARVFTAVNTQEPGHGALVPLP